MKTKCVVLKRAWSYTSMAGTVFTLNRGKKFRLNDNFYLDKSGNLIMRHWHAYNDGEIIPAEFLKVAY